ncbi:MAG: M1 family metallopeptidase [Bacteroidota bacterium]
MKKIKILIAFLFLSNLIIAQPDRWQQAIKYTMDIDFDVRKHQFKGKQKAVYTNNSPDQLNKVFYHLYFNAFQPGSMMDERSRSLSDADPRVGSRISRLTESEIGYHKIKSLKQNGKKVKYEVVGTILEVTLNEPIAPNSEVTFDMEFESQVPVQIRRSGRFNKEGIDYSMSQWYPKMCEYDYQGWHANPYVGREFYGIWGDFDVNITIARGYVVAATGFLENWGNIGAGYEPEGYAVRPEKGDTFTWKFRAKNVHDFVWAADPDYRHLKTVRDDGLTIHYFFVEGEKTTENWERLPQIMDRAFDFINKKYGQYPYQQYSFIQGGDGGMEYPQATLITGERGLRSLVGVSVHELMHSWYQMALGTNESLYAWMDEGFTSYASAEVMNFLAADGLLPGSTGKAEVDIHKSDYMGYINIVSSGIEEPLITHADHFSTNYAYGVGSYTKGAVFLHQLSYIIGKEAFDKGMLAYYDTWKFKHPNANDFIRIMEKASGLELDWYREYWVNTTHTIDYGVKGMEKSGRKSTRITLEKVGKMPMPIDVLIRHDGGKELLVHIPLRIMRGEKTKDGMMMKKGREYVVEEDWPWTHSNYSFEVPCKLSKIQEVIIDPTWRLADVNRNNNEKKIIKP